ncbi:MAG TPA: hypothetical protein VM262_15825 [Acidimicrobiales bacterium]|nr:hypothetical protein [Acidimicrobiales bacterium]
MHRLLALLFALALTFGLAAGCGDDDDDAGNGDDDRTEQTGTGDGDGAAREGNPEVYERIEGLSDCDELERELTAAETNAENRADDPDRQAILLSYAAAAEERMDEVGC